MIATNAYSPLRPLPPARPRARILYVGLSRSGFWVVRDHGGLIGGLFRTRHAAMRFALFETEHAPNAVLFVPEGLELDFSATSARKNAA